MAEDAGDPGTGANRAPSILSPGGSSEEGRGVVQVPLSVSDPDGDVVTVTSATVLPAGFFLDGGRLFVDTNHATFNGLAAGQSQTHTLRLNASDGVASSQAVFQHTVRGANDAPTAGADAATVGEDGSVVIDVLANDTDVDDGAALTLVSVEMLEGRGAATITDGKVRFDLGDPPASGGETVVLGYVIKDEHGATSSSTVTVTISVTNRPPVAAPDVAAGDENQVVTLDVLANDTDVDYRAVKSLVSVTVPSGKGSATIVDGKLVFDPGQAFDRLKAGEVETVVLDYVMQDEHGATSSSTVTLTLSGTNDAPVGTGQYPVIHAVEGSAPVAVDALIGLTDPDGDKLQVQWDDGSSQRGFTFDAATQTITFDPNHPLYDRMPEGSTELPALQYAVSDGTSTVYRHLNLHIKGSNDAPVANTDAAAGHENQVLTIDVLANDTDVDYREP